MSRGAGFKGPGEARGLSIHLSGDWSSLNVPKTELGSPTTRVFSRDCMMQ